MDANPHSNIGFIMKDGVLHRVHLKVLSFFETLPTFNNSQFFHPFSVKYRKAEIAKPVKRRKKRVQLEVTGDNM